MRIPRILSIRHPWAFAICEGKKDVENREWRTSYRGPLLIHAGLKPQKHPAVIEFCEYLLEAKLPADLPLGGIVGQANLVDVVSQSKSLWFQGPIGFVLADAKHLPFIPSKGQLGIYYPDQQLLAELRKKGIVK